MRVWEIEDRQGFPVKVEIQSSKDPVTMMHKDVSFDAPAASLFYTPGQLPADAEYARRAAVESSLNHKRKKAFSYLRRPNL